MSHFVGIDLGTTNSAICSYDGSQTRVWKSPEQNDVTPSAIYVDKRGNKYIGKRAYDSAPHNPDNAALLFKRYMGTSTPMHLAAANLTKTPEECSAEILKTLFGYLPEEIRNDPDTGTVITVPAAFNQMQKDATVQAAEMAGLGKVALMQEPVAAVMSVMSTHQTDGMFLIFDLGGGTLDIAIAESISGRVNLLSHGGIAMCGGRDFDRKVLDSVVKTWLLEHFHLPADLSIDPVYKSLLRLATWAAERAKIELSSREGAVISLSETEARVRDLDGEEIYLDIPLNRQTFDALISSKLDESIAATREALAKAGVTSQDVERIVFVGGPTNYKPLRDKVTFELGIAGNTDVNPMTAVAHGASLFAESIDWSSQNRARKSARGQLSSKDGLALSFNYIARTPHMKSRIAVQVAGEVDDGCEFQVDSIETGWTSGRMPLTQGSVVEVELTKPGENSFKVWVFDANGGPLKLAEDRIVISRVAATVDAIPSSHSISVEVLGKLGGKPELLTLVKEGDSLPYRTTTDLRAGESLKAGSPKALLFRLWEGEIEDPITDNRFIGCFKIAGTDFEHGAIPAGEKLEFTFEMLDSGAIGVEVSIPEIRGSFHSGNKFYSRQEGQMNFATASALVIEEGEQTRNRINELGSVVDDPKLDEARRRLEAALALDDKNPESEDTQHAMEQVYTAKKLLAQVKKEHRKASRQFELDHTAKFFDEQVRKHARPSEERAFDNLVKTAQRSIDRNDNDFEQHHHELKVKNFDVLWRQDWFVLQRFKWLTSTPHMFSDKSRFEELEAQGQKCVQAGDIDRLRSIVSQISSIQVSGGSEDDIYEAVNIVRG